VLDVLIMVYNFVNGDKYAAIAFFVLGLVVAFIVYAISFHDKALAPFLFEKRIRRVKVCLHTASFSFSFHPITTLRFCSCFLF
jgi:hypothetical protein